MLDDPCCRNKDVGPGPRPAALGWWGTKAANPGFLYEVLVICKIDTVVECASDMIH